MRHVQGIYAIMRVLRARHPQLDIEAYAGGGGRADLGVLRYADQIWDEYRLSMDGATRETYAHVRGVDAFDKIWRNLAAFTAMQREQQAMKPVVSLWFTAMRENLHELPALVELAHKAGIREVYLQRLVYFEEGLATSRQALFRRSTPEELAIVRRSEQLCKEYGITFKAAGSATPVESLVRNFGERPWSGCHRPYTLTYITSSGNVLSCCFAPFGHKSAREYQEERVLGNIFQEPIESICMVSAILPSGAPSRATARQSIVQSVASTGAINEQLGV